MTTEQRLDTVEDDLDVVKKLLASAARYAESANQGLDRLTERFDDLTAAQDRTQTQLDRLGFRDAAIGNLTRRDDLLAANLSQLTLTVNRLAESQQANDVALNNLARLVVRSVETAEADRAEIRRIWDYLLHQSGNGSGG